MPETGLPLLSLRGTSVADIYLCITRAPLYRSFHTGGQLSHRPNPCSIVSPAWQRSAEEVKHQAGDLIFLVFEREVSSAEQMQFGMRQITNIGAGSLGWKNHV